MFLYNNNIKFIQTIMFHKIKKKKKKKWRRGNYLTGNPKHHIPIKTSWEDNQKWSKGWSELEALCMIVHGLTTKDRVWFDFKY